ALCVHCGVRSLTVHSFPARRSSDLAHERCKSVYPSARSVIMPTVRGFSFLTDYRKLVLAAIASLGFIMAQPARAAYTLDVPFVPTPYEVVDRMLEIAQVGPDDHVIDLGS